MLDNTISKKAYELLLFDLDGTLYSGNQVIKEAPKLIQLARAHNQKMAFVTNNSTKTPDQVVRHLEAFGITAYPDEVITSSLVTAYYLQQQNADQVFIIGESGLRQAIEAIGDCRIINSPDYSYERLSQNDDLSNCQYVVVGLDRQMTYEKLACAAIAIRKGAGFIATNVDKALPTEHGLLPGNGSIVSLIQTATGVEPVVMGKPEQHILRYLDSEYNIDRTKMLMIGDNYETDIMLGINGQIDTALVYSGYTQPHAIKDKVQPSYQWDTLLQFEKEVAFYSSSTNN